MNDENVELDCQTTIEHLNPNGTTLKKVNIKNANIQLGRNEFRDLILKVLSKDHKYSFSLKNVKIHSRFVSQGKATLAFPVPKVNLMLSNCPPNKLANLIKTIYLKMNSTKKEPTVSNRQRLLSDRQRDFEKISPLLAKDFKSPNQKPSPLATPSPKRRKLGRQDTTLATTPKSQLKKVSKLIPKCLNLWVQFTTEQKLVLESVKQGRNVFFTGCAGTGKSFLLKHLVASLPPNSTVITASTGIAACQISGITLHSFAGIGTGALPYDQALSLAKRKNFMSHWLQCQHLVIDEISMVNAYMFGMMEKVARALKDPKKPFGGIQLIVCGDFFQLPPVTKNEEELRYCFQTSAWQKCFDRTIELTKVMRQSDEKFVRILQNIRFGNCNQEVQSVLNATSSQKLENGGIIATSLCTHNYTVDEINNSKLNALPGELKIFEAMDSSPEHANYLNEHAAPNQVKLKVGAQVMLTKNLDISKKLVNGARGVVVKFDREQNLPVVKFLNGLETIIKFERFPVRRYVELMITRHQIPLKLAWAVSVHKSQGMTLDFVEVSLSKVFAYGQAYVALSRARSLEGLKVLDFDEKSIKCHPSVVEFYRSLQSS